MKLEITYTIGLISLALLGFASSFEDVSGLEGEDSFVGRIYNGKSAVLGQIPYQGLLNIILPNNYYSYCGAALISNIWVLTAAHCVYNHTDVKIYWGLIDSVAKTGAVSTYAQNIYIHPNYSPTTYVNDIAILRLPRSVITTTNIKTIPLPKLAQSSPSSYDDKFAVASGWGKTSNTQTSIQRTLQYARVHIQNYTTCSRLFANYQYNQGHICTDKSIYSSPCKGDSGGPLVVNTTANPVSGTLVGLVSWAVGDCDNPYPNVYTYVGYYLPWIKKVTGLTTIV